MTQIQKPDPRDPQTYAVIGAAMEVHAQLGCGFLEPVYQEAMSIELATRAIPFMAQVEIPVYYKGRRLSAFYKADLVCYDSVIVELKALARLSSTEECQILNYLKAMDHRVGLLLNSGARSLEYKRYIGPNSQSSESVQSVKSVDSL